MAAPKTLDSASCATAADAFVHPLPQVRLFHRGLTTELEEKNGRLRALVGGSYRQLLGTAEMILEMREEIGGVEERLGRVGRGCGRGVVAGMASGLGRLQGEGREGRRAEEMAWVVRGKALEMCGLVVGRLLRRGEGRGKNLVTAAKVLVLSRLLAKSLSESPAAGEADKDKELVEESKRKLGGLRRRLLRAIERTLGRSESGDGREDLVQALCAYSLATSSGARDVLRHFLHVRGEAITLAFEAEDDVEPEVPGILRALELYTRTLLDVQALVPRRLTEALAALKTKPLLKDESIRELEGLRLDVSERWFGDQILFFTPYVRHDDLEVSQAVDTLRGWAKKASQVILEGFGKTLQRVNDFKTVVDLRTRCLEVWIKDGGKAKGFDPSVILNGLRNVINDRMVQLLESRVGRLHLVGTEIEGTLGTWRPGTTDQNASLWDEDMLEMEISNGASLFKQGVLARTHGRNDAVSRAVKGYQSWRHLVDEIVTVLDLLKKQRWDNDLEDIEDEASIESRNTLLSKDDPQMLQDHFDTSLEKAYTNLHEKISALLETYKDREDSGPMSIYILRVLRDIRSELPKNAALQSFGLSLVPQLHRKLATIVSADAVERFAVSLNRKSVPGRALWEGNPELPVQPSPAAFKFLRSLTMAMAQLGSDLWSPVAVRVLKVHLRSELGSCCDAALKAREVKDSVKAKTNGEAANGDSGTGTPDEDQHESTESVDLEKSKDVLIQSLFDILILKEALETKAEVGDGLQSVEKTIGSQIELESSSRKRLEQGAMEFWKKTSLLFGLLA